VSEGAPQRAAFAAAEGLTYRRDWVSPRGTLCSSDLLVSDVWGLLQDLEEQLREDLICRRRVASPFKMKRLGLSR
jgi:hypothetical protein